MSSVSTKQHEGPTLIMLGFFLFLIFLIDYLVPQGLAVEMLYILPTLIACFILHSIRVTTGVTIISIFLCSAGFFISPLGSGNITDLFNRGLSSAVIAAVAMICIRMTKAVSLSTHYNHLSHLAFELSPNGIVLEKKSGGILLANQHFLELFSLPLNEDIHQYRVADFIPKDHRTLYDNYRAQCFNNTKNSKDRSVEISIQNNQGGHTPIETVISTVETPLGQFMIHSITDMTEKKENQKKINFYIQELEQRNKDLDEFSFTASHELKAPLRAIKNMTTWIEEDSHLNQDAKDHLHKLRDRAKFMEDLLHDLFQYARIGRTAFDVERIHVTTFIENIWQSIDKPKDFQISIQSSLSSIETPKAPLDLVLRNLISNAIKHHHLENGLITIRCYEKNDRIYFDIQDNGPGIPFHYQRKVFDIFQSFHHNTEKGSGIGLAIVRKSVQRFKGDISLTSEENKGTTFTFSWPKNRDEFLSQS